MVFEVHSPLGNSCTVTGEAMPNQNWGDVFCKGNELPLAESGLLGCAESFGVLTDRFVVVGEKCVEFAPSDL